MASPDDPDGSSARLAVHELPFALAAMPVLSQLGPHEGGRKGRALPEVPIRSPH